MQQIRLNNLLPAATTEKLLLNGTPSTAVPIVRADGLPGASVILRLLPSTGTIVTLDVLTDEFGEAITDIPGGDTIETVN